MHNKRVIVAGGTYGIGASIVEAISAAGGHVVSLGRSAAIGAQQAAELNAKGRGAVHYLCCDVSSREQVKTAFATAVAMMGGLDAVVNVAGIAIMAPPELETDESWSQQFGINALGTFHTNQEAFPYLKESGGRIINFGSHSAVVGTAGNAVYAASKGAVMAWTRSVARAWAQYGITVNVLAPAIRTPMYTNYLNILTDEQRTQHEADMRAEIPLGGKLGDADTDLAPVIIFLLGEGARFITGQTIAVDGGLLMVR